MFVLASIGILALLILVHEAGHFAAAKWQGIHVNRFSLGFGPVLWRIQGKDTEYALRLLPLGGFVGFPDEDEDCPYPPQDPNLLKNRSVLDRLVVMAAGVMANLVFAYLVLVLMIAMVGVPTVSQYQPGILIPEVTPEGPAQQAGIQAGDIILVAGDQVFTEIHHQAEAEKAVLDFQTLIQSHGEQSLRLTIERPEQEELVEVTVIPRQEEGSKAVIGVSLTPHQLIETRRAKDPREVLREANAAYQRLVMINLQGFKQLLQNFENTAKQVSGPVGIVKIGAEMAKNDATSLFNFTALISINLAILNLLPLPALDGGHILFLLLEGLRGKRLPRQLEERVMQTGLVFLLGLGVVLIFKDTVALVSGSG